MSKRLMTTPATAYQSDDHRSHTEASLICEPAEFFPVGLAIELVEPR